MASKLKSWQKLNWKTIYFNLKYFPFKQAIKLPVFVSRRTYLRELSGRIEIQAPIRPGIIQIGYGKVGIFDNKRSRSIWEVSGTVIFKGKTNLGHGSKISVGKEGTLILGERFIITAESALVAHKRIEFGDDCLISWEALVMDTDFHSIKNENGEIINSPAEILIGNHVWISCRTTILKGSVIPNNTIIGANSLVNKKLKKEKCIYAGNPAECIKENISWEL